MVCVDCGGRVSGTDRKDRLPEPVCAACVAIRLHEARRWTREAIIAAIERWADEHGGIPPLAIQWFAGNRPEWAPSTNTVSNEFGTWGAGIRAAGFEPNAPGHYGRDGEDPEVCAEARRMYESGMSTLEIARELEVSTTCIAYRLWKVGTQMRSRAEGTRLYHARRRAEIAA